MSETGGANSSGLFARPVGPEAGRDELRRRVTYLMLFRLVLITMVLGATIVIAWVGDADLTTTHSVILFGIIIATYLVTVGYALRLEQVTRLESFADLQLAVDLLITSLLVHITGGAQSAYSFFFPLSIIGAATVRFRAGALAVAASSAGLFTVISVLGWVEILPAPSGQHVLPADLSTLQFVRALALNLAGMTAVGFLAANLGSQVQRTVRSLESERSAAADLFAVHEDIVRCLSSGLITIDDDERILTANHAALEILGLAKSPVGQPLRDVSRGLASALPGLVPHAAARRLECEVNVGPRSLVLGLSVSPLVDHRDREVGRIVNFQDLSDLRAMERQVKRAERLATIGTLAAGIAHELRNPLASISGSVELLRATPDEGSEDRALMDIVNREVGRLDALVSQLLDYANPRPPQAVRFDLRSLLEETITVFRQDQSFADVELGLEDSASSEPFWIVADPSKMRQVVWNLMRNAADASRRGGRSVRIALVRSARDAVVEIHDDGPGISDQDLERIFDPFFTTKSTGTGLGLAIVQSIVEEHEGHIAIHTRPGEGTTFEVRVPVGDIESEKHSEITLGPAPPAG